MSAHRARIKARPLRRSKPSAAGMAVWRSSAEVRGQDRSALQLPAKAMII